MCIKCATDVAKSYSAVFTVWFGPSDFKCIPRHASGKLRDILAKIAISRNIGFEDMEVRTMTGVPVTWDNETTLGTIKDFNIMFVNKKTPQGPLIDPKKDEKKDVQQQQQQQPPVEHEEERKKLKRGLSLTKKKFAFKVQEEEKKDVKKEIKKEDSKGVIEKLKIKKKDTDESETSHDESHSMISPTSGDKKQTVSLSVPRSRTGTPSNSGGSSLNSSKGAVASSITSNMTFDDDDENSEDEENDNATGNTPSFAKLDEIFDFVVSNPKYLALFLASYRAFTTPQFLISAILQKFKTSSDVVRMGFLFLLNAWIDDNRRDFELEKDSLLPVLDEIIVESKKLAVALREIKNILSKPPPVYPLVRGIGREFAEEYQNILGFDSLEVAHQLTLIEQEIFQQINLKEFIGKAWTKEGKEQNAPGIVLFTKCFNQTSNWVRSEILLATTFKERIRILSKFLEIADHLMTLNNYNGLMEILSAFNSGPVHRLKKTLAGLPSRYASIYKNCLTLVNNRQNYLNLRDQYKLSRPPLIPYLGMYMTDFVFIDDGNETFDTEENTKKNDNNNDVNVNVNESTSASPSSKSKFVDKDNCDEKKINFKKIIFLGRPLVQLQKFQKCLYDIAPSPDVLKYLLKDHTILTEEEAHLVSRFHEPGEGKEQPPMPPILLKIQSEKKKSKNKNKHHGADQPVDSMLVSNLPTTNKHRLLSNLAKMHKDSVADELGPESLTNFLDDIKTGKVTISTASPTLTRNFTSDMSTSSIGSPSRKDPVDDKVTSHTRTASIGRKEQNDSLGLEAFLSDVKTGKVTISTNATPVTSSTHSRKEESDDDEIGGAESLTSFLAGIKTGKVNITASPSGTTKVPRNTIASESSSEFQDDASGALSDNEDEINHGSSQKKNLNLNVSHPANTNATLAPVSPSSSSTSSHSPPPVTRALNRSHGRNVQNANAVQANTETELSAETLATFNTVIEKYKVALQSTMNIISQLKQQNQQLKLQQEEQHTQQRAFMEELQKLNSEKEAQILELKLRIKDNQNDTQPISPAIREKESEVIDLQQKLRSYQEETAITIQNKNNEIELLRKIIEQIQPDQLPQQPKHQPQQQPQQLPPQQPQQPQQLPHQLPHQPPHQPQQQSLDEVLEPLRSPEPKSSSNFVPRNSRTFSSPSARTTDSSVTTPNSRPLPYTRITTPSPENNNNLNSSASNPNIVSTSSGETPKIIRNSRPLQVSPQHSQQIQQQLQQLQQQPQNKAQIKPLSPPPQHQPPLPPQHQQPLLPQQPQQNPPPKFPPRTRPTNT